MVPLCHSRGTPKAFDLRGTLMNNHESSGEEPGGGFIPREVEAVFYSSLNALQF